MVERINGINTESLNETIDLVRDNPEFAKFTFIARNQWITGTHNKATIHEFYQAGQRDLTRNEPLVFDEDEPPILLGKNKGANPVEFVLVGLSGCLTTSLVSQAAIKGIELKSVESELKGNLDVRGFLGISKEVRNGFESINVRFNIISNASDEKIQELVSSAKQYSPVYDIITNKVPVSVDFERHDIGG